MLELSGTETVTIEVGGSIAAGALEGVLAASRLTAESDADGVRVSVLLFRMDGLHLRGLPWPSFGYGEALWRIAVRHQGLPAWLAVACDLDSWFIRRSGARLIRYPVRRARFSFSVVEPGFCAQVDGAAGGMVVRVAAGQEARSEAPRPLLVHADGTLYRVPWREEPAPYRRVAELEPVAGTLAAATFGGPVRWDRTGVIHRGRTHFCGVARRA